MPPAPQQRLHRLVLSLRQSIFPELADLGGSRSLRGVLDQGAFVSGHTEYGVEGGIAYDVLLSNTGEAVLVTGTASALLTCDCARCLEPASFQAEGEVEGYFLLEQADSLDGYEEDEFECVDAEGGFDVGPCIHAAIASSIPFAVYCKDDCLGLCPHCGGNMNLGECTCEGEPVDPLNPFAALAGLSLEDDE